MSKKLKLTKIKLETKDGKEVELSMDEAKELHDQLHTLFGDKAAYIPSMPIIIERDRWLRPYQPYWAPYCTSSADIATLCSVAGDSGLSVTYCGTNAAEIGGGSSNIGAGSEG
jgi:hypothetical protein